MNITADFINTNTDFNTLIEKLRKGFAKNEIIVPMRHHHDFLNEYSMEPTTMLLMPAWHPNQNSGVKIVTVSPDNYKWNLPSIQGSYLFMDTKTGMVKAIIEAKALTAKRTAAASALAADYLAKKSANSLLVIGTGALAPNLIKAHCSIRPIKTVYVWGRQLAKAEKICEQFVNANFEIKAVETIESIISKVDIISCATLSKTPLVLGKYLQKGQHVDLVGSFKPDMRESDNEVMRRANIFVDTFEGSTKESGDLVIPLQEKVIVKSDIKSDLFDLCNGSKQGRKSDDEITVFKSVGHALEDLVAAEYYFESYSEAPASEK